MQLHILIQLYSYQTRCCRTASEAEAVAVATRRLSAPPATRNFFLRKASSATIGFTVNRHESLRRRLQSRRCAHSAADIRTNRLSRIDLAAEDNARDVGGSLFVSVAMVHSPQTMQNHFFHHPLSFLLLIQIYDFRLHRCQSAQTMPPTYLLSFI